jgi:hypothetical protein
MGRGIGETTALAAVLAQQHGGAIELKDTPPMPMAKPRLSRPSLPEAMPAAPKSQRPPARRDRRAITVWITPDKHQQLRHLAVDLDLPLQALLTEAVDLVLERHDGGRRR